MSKSQRHTWYSNIIIFLHNMRNMCTICLQYDGGKVGMELGENGTYSINPGLSCARLQGCLRAHVHEKMAPLQEEGC